GMVSKFNILNHSAPWMSAEEIENGEPEPLIEGKTLRTSSYTIYVDLPGESDQMLLVHGYTGAFDKVSRRVATYVRSLERKRAPKPLYGEWSPESAGEDGTVPPP